MTVFRDFARIAARQPDRPAVALGGAALSYGALAGLAERVAARLLAEGLGGGRVALLLPNRAEFPALFLGIAMAGAAAMVLDPKWPPAQRDRVLALAEPDLILADPALREGVPGRVVDCAAWLGEVGAGGAAGGGVGLPDIPDTAPFYIGFTSGTTGTPKAFARSHRSWTASFATGRAAFGLEDGDRILAPGPLVHSLFLYAAIDALGLGASVHLLPAFDAQAALGIVEAAGITRLYLVPTMAAALVEAARGRSFPGLRTVLFSGAKLQPALRAAVAALFPAAEIVEFYGASELSFVSYLSSRQGGPAESVGRAFPGVEIKIRRDDGGPAAPGEVGQLWLRSEMLCLGYLHPTDGSGYRVEGGWATVGDRASVDAAGFLTLAGREGDMLITGGLNVYPAEVEAALAALPEIAQAAVLGRPDPYWGEAVCAVIGWRGPARLDLAGLQARLRDRLPAYKIPREVYVRDRFPETASGKVARAALRDWMLGPAAAAARLA
ncbi:MAG TPA: AMP-binding protein [Alphaproteobacteria bacterium]|nr:AMP-binding protein [Alphaproteobacteria bacterium]